MYAFEFDMPTRVIFGEDAVSRVGVPGGPVSGRRPCSSPMQRTS